MSTLSRWTTTKPQMVPIRDSNRHTEATTLAVYMPLHIVQLNQYLILHTLPVFTSIYMSYMSVFEESHLFWGNITIYVGLWSHGESLTQVCARSGKPPPAAVLGTRCRACV